MKKIVFALVVGVVLALPAVSAARTDRELTYRENEIWHSAIRFLRVDSGFKILEKDKDAGYVLFEYKDGAAKCTASFEMVRAARGNKSFVRARIQIENQPRYVESVLIDRFIRKLKDEYGEPPPPQLLAPEVKPSPPPTEEGASPNDGKTAGKSMADGEEDPGEKDEAELEPKDQELEENREAE
jgi:hypothetical protein